MITCTLQGPFLSTVKNIDSITAPVTAPPSDIHQLHHPMAQHATSHFISKIIIADSAYQDGMDPKHERQSVGTFYSGIHLFFRFVFPSVLHTLRLHELICKVRQGVGLCSVMRRLSWGSKDELSQ